MPLILMMSNFMAENAMGVITYAWINRRQRQQ